ncbi:ABC transporter ATP-binding protein/permease [Pontimonas sp.]|nr:ABC transporter ATP-binding protein [Pontimonas sp.]MDA8909480.1 ABC transporter ATP-binding protein/permease [Pontimonas sp.]
MFSIILRSWELLTTPQKVVTGGIALSRVLVNGLDLLALFLLAVLVSLASGSSLEIPIVMDSLALFEEPLLALLILTALIFVLKSVLALFLFRLTYILLARIETAASMKIVESVFGSGLTRLKKFGKAELDWTVLRSTKVAFSDVLGSATLFLAEATLAAMVIVVFFATDWLMAIYAVMYFSAIAVAFQRFSRAKIIKAGQDFSAGTISAGQALRDLAGAFREISVSAKKPFFIERIRKSRNAVSLAQAKAQYIQTIPRIVVEMGLIVGAVAFLVFEYVRTNGEPDVSVLAIFLVGGLRMMASLLPLQRAVVAMRYNQAPAAAAQKILKDMATQPAPATRANVDAPFVSDAAPSVQIKALSFKYEDSEGESLALEGISLDVEPGSFVALIGPSGGGKSSLVDIVLSLQSPTSGEVLINRQPSSLYQESHPGLVAYVPQNFGAVSGNIRDNVALGVPGHGVDDDRVWKALDDAQLGEVVRAMPNGINSDLGKNTDSLSGGQMQRLGIARALYLRARLLILDEATSALDPETESQILSLLLSLRGSTTIVVIAHRLSTIKKADRIYVLNAGKMVASGTFNELRRGSDLVKRFIRLMSLDD